MSAPEIFETYKQFDGRMNYYRHQSEVCGVPMNFTAYIPPSAEKRKLPVLYWLSGITSTWEIFMLEGGCQAHAKKYDVIIVAPDTSPRGTGIPGEADVPELGTGASFYVDATEKKWARHFRMESYVTRELRQVVEATLPARPDRRAIGGHSMGGHGALVLGLRNAELYTSISAFAPIASASRTPWGQQALAAYLGPDRKAWARYDAAEVLRATKKGPPILIDQGTKDELLPQGQLLPEELEKAIADSRYPSATFRKQPDYDHGYFFVSTFIEEHIAFHAKHF